VERYHLPSCVNAIFKKLYYKKKIRLKCLRYVPNANSPPSYAHADTYNNELYLAYNYHTILTFTGGMGGLNALSLLGGLGGGGAV